MNLLVDEFVHEDERRTLRQLFTADVKQVNVYEAKKGSILGNHYHKETVEYFYLIEGELLYNDLKVLRAGDIFVVYPKENHTLECLTDLKLMSFLSKPYSQKEPDLWKKES